MKTVIAYEIIDHGVNGVLCAHANPIALADALQALLTDDDRAQQLAQAGAVHVRQAFDKRSMRTQYLDLFQSLRGQLDKRPRQ